MKKKVHWLLLYFSPMLYCAFCFLKLNNKIVNSNQLKFLLHFNIHVCFLLSHRKIPWKCYGMSIATIEIIFPFWNKIFGLLPKFLSTIHITTYTLGHRSAMSQQQFGCHYLSPPNFVKSGTGCSISDGSGTRNPKNSGFLKCCKVFLQFSPILARFLEGQLKLNKVGLSKVAKTAKNEERSC